MRSLFKDLITARKKMFLMGNAWLKTLSAHQSGLIKWWNSMSPRTPNLFVSMYIFLLSETEYLPYFCYELSSQEQKNTFSAEL